MTAPAYRRVIVKLSGEALAGPDASGIHTPTLNRFAADLVAALGARIFAARVLLYVTRHAEPSRAMAFQN